MPDNTGAKYKDSDNSGNNTLSQYITSFNPFDNDIPAKTSTNLFPNVCEADTSMHEEDINHDSDTSTNTHSSTINEYLESFHPCSASSDICKCFAQHLVKENAISYITGYMCHKILQFHDCNECKSKIMHDSPNESASSLFLNFKGGRQASFLCTPKRAFVNLIDCWESVFKHNISDLICRDGLKNEIIKLIKSKKSSQNIFCDGVEDEAIDISVRMRIYYHTKFTNRNITMKRPCPFDSNTSALQKNRKLQKVMHI